MKSLLASCLRGAVSLGLAVAALALVVALPLPAPGQDAPGAAGAPEMYARPFTAQVLVQSGKDFAVPKTVPNLRGEPIAVASVVVVDDQGKKQEVPQTGDVFRGKTPTKGGTVKLLAAGGATIGIIALLSGGGGGGGGGSGGTGGPVPPHATAADLAPVVGTRPGPTIPLGSPEAPSPGIPPAPPVPDSAPPGLTMPDGVNPMVVQGTFEPNRVSGYQVSTEFTSPPTSEGTPIVAEGVPVLATGEALVVITPGAPDQTGPAHVVVEDTTTGQTQIGDFMAWSARVQLTESTTTPGAPVGGRICIEGLPASSKVRFTLTVPDGTLAAPGAAGGTWTGVESVEKLTATPFTVVFGDSGLKNVYLDLEPLKTPSGEDR